MRDKRGRFTKVDGEGIALNLSFPSINKLLLYLLIIIVMLPWLAIVSKWRILNKIFDFIESLFIFDETNCSAETPKKNGLFY